ncbi:MAG: RNA-guided endonuclease InsQ/TnpB family protein [Steroidobacteraceae bacterium]
MGLSRWASVRLPVPGRVKLRRSDALPGAAALSDAVPGGWGPYFASICTDQVRQSQWPEPATDAMGIDLGLRVLAVVSDGEQVRTLRTPEGSEARPAAPVSAAPEPPGGCAGARPRPRSPYVSPARRGGGWRCLAYGPRRARIARLHGRIADLRRDALHRVSTALVGQARILVLEDLNVKALSRGGRQKGFRRALGDVALGELRRQIRYKAAWARRQVIEIDRYYPSSKRCFECGTVNTALGSAKRWECPACGASHDRDENAAKNIRAEGMQQHAATCSVPTGQGPGSDARGVACAAERTRRQTVECAQRRPTQNRELAPRPARAKTARVLSGTAR